MRLFCIIDSLIRVCTYEGGHVMGPYQIDFTIVQYVNRQVQPSGRASIEPVTRINRVQRIRPRQEEWLEEEQAKSPGRLIDRSV